MIEQPIPHHGRGNQSPLCPSCGKVCKPGISWHGVNFCRALVLLRVIEDEPDLTAWQIYERSGINYSEALKGLQKLREHRAVKATTEVRSLGGFRYKYEASSDLEARQQFVTATRRVEALNAI